MTVPLATIRALTGPAETLTGWCDAWVASADESDDAWGVDGYLLSLVGSPLAVRALQSAFLAHSPLRITPPDGPRLTLHPANNAIYRTRWSRLPSGALHGLLLADLSHCPRPASRLVLASSDDALPDALLTDLLAHRGLMALPKWRGWLCSRLLEVGGATRLAGPVPALRVTASEEELDALVQTGLRDGAIAFPAL